MQQRDAETDTASMFAFVLPATPCPKDTLRIGTYSANMLHFYVQNSIFQARLQQTAAPIP